MDSKIEHWRASGEFINYGPLGHQVFVKQLGVNTASPNKTLLLLHGFPESSYSYHAVLDGLGTRFDRIVIFDLIGFGLSDKPAENYSYSLLEQADVALKVWQHFGITGGHLLAHDMGTSVATELLFRHESDLLPAWFSTGFQSITFTNGSMVMAFSKLRLAQKILLTKFGKSFGQLVNYGIFSHQVRSAHGNDRLSEDEIQQLWAFNSLQDGHRKSYLTIKYINDRHQFEHCRWLPALKQTKLPINLCWGDQDQVARIEMAHYLHREVCPQSQLIVMPGLGHFGQLGSPEEWVEWVLGSYKAL